MTKTCPCCKQPIRERRSDAISTRFHGHCTWMARQLQGQKSRDEVYLLALLRACEIEPPEGGEPYPYVITARRIAPGGPVMDVLDPLRTSGRSNRQMMTACRACEYLAVEWQIGPLPEKYDDEGRPG
jgi:hypothetical protein